MATGNPSTRRLKPWLVEQIESRKYHGLMWDNDEKTCFRIPWKHAGKQDFRYNEDAAIFMAWAQYKNKYKNGDRVDAAGWKTRLRCALNKSPEFQEVPNRSQLDISEPYKVYKIVPVEEQENPSSAKPARKRKSIALANSSELAEKGPHVKREKCTSEIMEVASCASADSGNGSDTSGADISYTDQYSTQSEPLQPDHHPIGLSFSSENPSSAKPARKRKSIVLANSSELAEKEPHAKQEQCLSEIMEVASCASADSGNGSESGADISYTDQYSTQCEPLQPYLLPTGLTVLQSPSFPSEIAHTDMQITVLYSGVEVSKVLVHSGECKLSASASIQRFSGMEHVLLPVPGEPLDEETCKKTESLLKFLEAGVMLASNNDGIFAQRQKKCSGRVFWIGPCVNSPGTINKLERDEHVKLFDTQKFLQELEIYKTNGGAPPVYYVTLCFGEEISDRDPSEDKLITAKIEQVIAYEMVRKATESLNNAQIQDSILEEPTFSNLTPLLPVDTCDIYS